MKMHHFTQEELSSEQQYKFLSGSVIPRPIAWVSTLSKGGKVLNVAPFSLFSIVSQEEPLVSLSIFRKNGKVKDTARNLLENGEVVIHIVDGNLLDEMNQTAASLSETESELSLVDLQTVSSQRVKVPGLKEAKIRFEGRVRQHIEIMSKNQEKVATDHFIIEVLDFYFSSEVFDEVHQYIDVVSLNPVGRLAGPSYSLLGEIIKLQRPL